MFLFLNFIHYFLPLITHSGLFSGVCVIFYFQFLIVVNHFHHHHHHLQNLSQARIILLGIGCLQNNWFKLLALHIKRLRIFFYCCCLYYWCLQVSFAQISLWVLFYLFIFAPLLSPHHCHHQIVFFSSIFLPLNHYFINLLPI